MKYIIGLGNPGVKYAKTRHNVGWLVLVALADKFEAKWRQSNKAKSFYAKAEINGQEVELLRPAAYMNNSGQTVLYVKKKHPDVQVADFIVIHDDKDLDFGDVRVVCNRSSAGHRGVESVIAALGSKEFTRIRVGIKNELLEKMETDKFVLAKFSREERRQLEKEIVPQAVRLLEDSI